MRRRAAEAEAIPGYFEHHNGTMTALVGGRMSKVLRPHQEWVDRLIETARKTAADLFEIPYRAPAGEKTFQIVRRPYWVHANGPRR